MHIPKTDAKLRQMLEQYTTDPIYKNILIDLVSHFITFYMLCHKFHNNIDM